VGCLFPEAYCSKMGVLFEFLGVEDSSSVDDYGLFHVFFEVLGF